MVGKIMKKDANGTVAQYLANDISTEQHLTEQGLPDRTSRITRAGRVTVHLNSHASPPRVHPVDIWLFVNTVDLDHRVWL